MIWGRPRRNVIIPSRKTSESSNDSNGYTITDNDLEDDNFERPIPVATAITHVWGFNVRVKMVLCLCPFFSFSDVPVSS